MFPKKSKPLYTLTADERAFVLHTGRQIAMGQLALQQFLNSIATRERLPNAVQFDPDKGTFAPAPAEPAK